MVLNRHRIQEWSIEPPASIRDPERRLQARTLSGMLLLIIPFTTIGAIFGYTGLCPVTIVLVIAYVISRTKYTSIAAAICLVVLTAPCYLQAISARTHDMVTLTFVFSWALIPMLMSAVILPPPGTYIFTGANVVGVLIFTAVMPSIDMLDTSAALGLLATSAVLVVLSAYLREQYLSERRRVENRLKASLQEKDVLLKEIHHRVKNNLQIISSLLNLQSRSIEDEVTRAMLRDSQNRIQSMALTHEQLYFSESLSQVDMREYVCQLTNYLRGSYGPQAMQVTISVEVADIYLGIDQAIPCGLIINELISNALKHAFPDGTGTIRVALHSEGDNILVLRVEDDGIGLPADMDIAQVQSLGLQLVVMLVRQLGGTITEEHGKGTHYRITFTDARGAG